MEYFIQQMINGITLGSIYGLIAIGYTMVYGIIGMINFGINLWIDRDWLHYGLWHYWYD